jgi:methylase of polypeptide subunit release factors
MSIVEDRALSRLGERLRASGYRFVTPTPATHHRVNARPEHAETTTIEGALGWSRPFREAALPAELVALLAEAGVLRRDGALCRSTVRYSTIAAAHGDGDGDGDAALYLHSAYPTIDPDAVFFGPDTYRFVAALRQDLRPARRLVDIGAGSGAGALSVLDRCGRVVLADINPLALRYARINAALARRTDDVEAVESDVLASVHGELDAVIANPPYLADRHARTYRDGGGALGLELSLRIVREALARLAPGGQLILYTGSPVIDGAHPLRAALRPILATRAGRARWRELDPDVFGEELDAAPYDRVDRIAVIALVVDLA